MTKPTDSNTKPKLRALPPGLRPPMRWYLHGDECAEAPGTYYCRPCDIFIGRAHFTDDAHKDSCWGRSTLEICRQTRAYFEERLQLGWRIYRPTNAKNPWLSPPVCNIFKLPLR